MGTYNASAYNDNHTLLKLICNIQDYLTKNPNVGVYYTLGFQGEVGTTSIPKDKVYGPAGSDNKPSVGDIILYALDIGQGFFQVSGVNNVNYIGEIIGQTVPGPKGDRGPEGPTGPKGDTGEPGVKVYYTTGFQGEVGTTSIPKDKVHGPEGSTTTPIIGDIILYALDIGQGFFQVSGVNNVNYIGEIIKAVDDAGMTENTIFIVTSDHGGIDKGHGGKTMAEMETPFIIAGKGIKSGTVITHSMMQFDVASTLAHIFRISQPQVWIGRPMKQVFK